jgi:LPXTG-site transpeptidase (sortase) family protein
LTDPKAVATWGKATPWALALLAPKTVLGDAQQSGPDPAAQDLLSTSPRYWTDSREALGALDAGDAIAEGYGPPSADVFAGPALAATSIQIPAIGVDSALQELKIVNLGDSKSWETPKNVVGHIPTTATPGREGQGWYFGHLESPIAGEGSVFSRLPKIPDLLRKGEDVFVVLEGADRKYLYQVYKTEVVPAEELRITDSGAAEITLVTCYPRLTYSHRLMVTAKLIGVQDLDRMTTAKINDEMQVIGSR